MKLYTEKEIRTAILIGSIHLKSKTMDELVDSLTPIELPSDEEIIKAHDAKEFQFISFWAGAAWYRNKILNQNK